MTALLYAMREREMIMDLMEMITGARMHTSFCRVGGVREDLPDEHYRQDPGVLRHLPEPDPRLRAAARQQPGVPEAHAGDRRDHRPRTRIDLGLSGPNLRASGVDWDIRRDEPYEIYDRLDFNVITRDEGDCFARWQCRVEEMRESVRIIEQCLDQMPEGPFQIDMPTIAFPVDKDQRPLLDGGADPALRPLGLRLQGAQGRGLFGDRGAKGRARLLHHQRRQPEAVPHEGAGAVLRQPSGAVRRPATRTTWRT